MDIPSASLMMASMPVRFSSFGASVSAGCAAWVSAGLSAAAAAVVAALLFDEDPHAASMDTAIDAVSSNEMSLRFLINVPPL